jgi:hypothetical protein
MPYLTAGHIFYALVHDSRPLKWWQFVRRVRRWNTNRVLHSLRIAWPDENDAVHLIFHRPPDG